MKQKAFTLIELLVVIGIIGILSTIGVVSFGKVRAKARDARRWSDIKMVEKALRIYLADKELFDGTGSYGENENNTIAPCIGISPGGTWDSSTCDQDGDGLYWVDFLVTKGYLAVAPVDPLNNYLNGYYYRYYYYPATVIGWYACPYPFAIVQLLNFETSQSEHGGSGYPGYPTCGQWSTANGYTTQIFIK